MVVGETKDRKKKMKRKKNGSGPRKIGGSIKIKLSEIFTKKYHKDTEHVINQIVKARATMENYGALVKILSRTIEKKELQYSTDW